MITAQTIRTISTFFCLLGLILFPTLPTTVQRNGGQELRPKATRGITTGLAYAASWPKKNSHTEPSIRLVNSADRGKAMNKFPKPVPRGQIRKRTKEELITHCNRLPRCRAQLQKARKGLRLPNVRPPRKSRSSLESPNPQSNILSWLNPFDVSPVQAQSDFSLNIILPDWKGPSIYSGSIKLYGASYWGGFYLYDKKIITLPGSHFAENNPHVQLYTGALPAEGWYFVNFQAGRGKAKSLRHNYRGQSIETWDFSNSSCSPCDYLALFYLKAGTHRFSFWPNDSSFYIYGVSVNSL